MKKIDDVYKKVLKCEISTEELLDCAAELEEEFKTKCEKCRTDSEIIPEELMPIIEKHREIFTLMPNSKHDVKIEPSEDGKNHVAFWSMDIYQQKTRSTAIYPRDKALEYLALGLVGEAGEVANKIKKVIRGDKNKNDLEFREQIKDELGDVMWYLAQLCDAVNTSMSSIADRNIAKLALRKSQNKLKGDGDNR